MDFSHLVVEDWSDRAAEVLSRASLCERRGHRLSHLRLSLRFEEEGRTEKVWRISLRNESADRREISVAFLVPALQQGWRLFFPSGQAHPSWERGALRYGYRDTGAPLSMPMVTVYHPGEDRGFTYFSDFKIPIQRMSVIGDHGREPNILRIARTHLRLEGDDVIETSLHVAEHDGDWRPGLGLIRDKYHDFFFTKNSEVENLFGAFVFSTSVPPEEYVRRWKVEGVTAVEVHYTYPFLCKFVPTEEAFVRAMDDVWSYAKLDPRPDVPAPDATYDEIKAYLNRTARRDGRAESIRSYIRILHKHGLKGFIYFQPSEPWERFARRHFPEYLIRDARNEEEPVWYENIVANPFPEGKFGQYIIRQFQQLLDLYPEIDGIFMDEACYDQLDFSQDDGFSIESGRPAYRMGYAICKVTQQLCKLARERGKVIWWNGPYQVEIAREADGMMAEGGGMQGESIQYLAIGNKPTCCLVYNERQLKRNLVLGLLPTAPSFAVTGNYRLVAEMPKEVEVSPDDVELHRRYFPLFEHFRGKTWVLTSHPISLPSCIDGNIFQIPTGDYVVTLVSMEQSTTSRAYLWDLPVAIRVPRASDIHDVYLRLAEEVNYFKLPFERSEGSIKVLLPRFRSAGILLINKNVCSKLISPKNFPRTTSDRVIDLFWEGRPGVVVGESGWVKVHCVNNSDHRLELKLSAEGRGVSIVECPSRAFVEPRQRQEMSVRVKGDAPGHSSALLCAASRYGDSRLEIPVEIWAASFAVGGLVPLLSAALRFDMFTPDGAPDMRFIDGNGRPKVVKDRPVCLNGYQIGSLPSRNNPFWRLVFTVPVPEPLLVHIARENFVTIRASSLEDAFKVRNISLELELVNGVRLSSTEDTNVYSSRQCDFSEGIIGNPITVRLDFDQLDRQARRYDDWNRES